MGSKELDRLDLFLFSKEGSEEGFDCAFVALFRLA